MPPGAQPNPGPAPVPLAPIRPPKPSLWSYWSFRALLLVLLLGGAAGFYKWKGRAAYRQWREASVVAQAETLLKEKKYADAVVAARRALQLNEANVPAARVMAEIAELGSARDAILWRSRVAMLEPHRAENLHQWAYTALRFNDLATARQALDRFPPEARNSLQYHEIAGVLDFSAGHPDAAETHWEAALATAPQNESLQLNLAKARLFSSQTNKVQQAYATLEKLRAAGSQQVPALSVLTSDALRRNDLPRARDVAAQLRSHPATEFPDLLLSLTVARLADTNAFPDLLQRLQEKSRQSPDHLASLIQWLNASQLSTQAVAWTAQLPPDLTAPATVGLAIADALATVKNWPALQKLVTDARWEEADFLRIAYQAYALNDGQPQALNPRVKALWQDAVARARQRPDRVEILANLAIKWGWRPESEEAWWIIANGNTAQGGALKVLYNYYLRSGNTPGLQRVLERMFALNPDDLLTKNNLAVVNLLLNLKPSLTHRLGQELYTQHPTNTSYLSTYAFSLHRQQKNAQALELLGQLNQTNLAKPSIAAYYGAILAADGRFDQAIPYLNLATNAQLLPEELQLVKSSLTLAQEFRAFADLFAKDPANPVNTANYAYALHRQHRTTEALALFTRLGAQPNLPPPAALRHAVLLTAAGQWENARATLARNPDTAALHAAADQLFQRDPQDPAVKLLAATLAAQLEPRLADALTLAQQLHDLDPANPAPAATLAFTLHRQGKSTDALNLLAKLPEAQLRNPAIAPFHGILLAAAGQLDPAAAALALARPELLFPEERALVTHAQTFATEFRQLHAAYQRNPSDPAALAAYAFALHRQRKTPDALRLLETPAPGATTDPGLVACRAALVQNGETPRLYTAAQALHRTDPADPGVRYLVASLGLLVDPRPEEPVRLAQDLLLRDAQNPAYACAYAYSLHRQRRTLEGLRVIAKLPPKDLGKPLPALYAALLLAADNQLPRAREYLALATDQALLPEELKLANETRALLRATP